VRRCDWQAEKADEAAQPRVERWFGAFGQISFDWAFLSGLFSIVIIDLILAGDNAVVIAMAVRSLPHHQRKKGSFSGRRLLSSSEWSSLFCISDAPNHFIKLVGGILITWIAVKLLSRRTRGTSRPQGDEHRRAIKIIVIADNTMALDNMLAVAGASHGNLFLLLFGLGLSIPFVVFTSNLLSLLMDKYPIIVYLGAGILGKVGGEMIITDPVVTGLLAPGKVLQYSIEAIFAVGVIVAGKLGSGS
jgi:YjbE family integral membrane protein